MKPESMSNNVSTINGVVFKIKPYENEGILIWLLPIFGMNRIGKEIIPLCGKEDQYPDLGYNDLQFVNFHVDSVKENGAVSIQMVNAFKCTIEEGGDTPIYVFYKNGDLDFLLTDILEDIKEGAYGQQD